MPSSLWFFTNSGLVVPAGIIVPFMDDAGFIPSGWTQWTDGETKALRGVTSSAGGTGGSTYVSRSSSNSGNHTGSSSSWWFGSSAGSANDLRSLNATGSHSHSFRIYYTPAKRKQILIKADEDTAKFPAKTGFLHTDNLSSYGLSDEGIDGYILSSNNGSSSSSSGSSQYGGNESTAGAHEHLSGTGAPGSSGYAYSTQYSQGGHNNHGISVGVTDNIYRYLIGLWSSVGAAIAPINGMIGMWESDTAPDGWSICDGTNGTPDLSGYFLQLSITNKGTKTGTGKITTWATLATAGSHEHAGTWAVRNIASSGYHANSVSHSHSAGSSESSYDPQYYNIIFIQATG